MDLPPWLEAALTVVLVIAFLIAGTIVLSIGVFILSGIQWLFKLLRRIT